MAQSFFHRRSVLAGTALALAAGATALTPRLSKAAEPDMLPPGAGSLHDLMQRLSNAPRRRDFKTVPMILNDRSQWDHEALAELMDYRREPLQVFDNTDLASPWTNVMRNWLNSQIWSFDHPDALAVSATHGSAHLALYDQAMWDKYQFAKLAGEKFKTNTLIEERKAPANPADYENPEGAFSPEYSSIPALQQRGLVFTACHNAIWELSLKLIATGVNPDKHATDELAAELTNHLIPGCVLTPGAVGTITELQRAGYNYMK